MGEEYRITIPGILERIPDVCDAVVAAARRSGFNERAVYHCQMAVDEACTNIVEHGYGMAQQVGQIEVIYRNEPDRCVITIADNGPPFNPLAREDPDPTMALSDRKPGGWGIYFIKKMMDETSYTYENGRNYLTIVKLKTPQNMAPAARTTADTGIAVHTLTGSVREISPSGRLDSNAAPDLQAVLDAQLDDGHVHLIVNMTDISYISTSGLKVLVNAWRRARDASGNVALVGLKPQILEVFETVGFDQIFSIFDTTDEALKALYK